MYELPEDLSALTVEELDTELSNAREALDGLKIGEDSSDDDLEVAITIVDGIAALQDQHVIATAAAEESATKRADTLAKVAEATKVEEEPVEPVVEPVEKVEPVVEKVPAAEVEVVKEPEPVSAAAKAEAVARAAQNQPTPKVPADVPAVATVMAAADVPGFATGSELDGMAGATLAVLARTAALPTQNLATATGGVRQRYGAAIIKKAGFQDFQIQKPGGGDDYGLVWRATDEKNLPGQSLLAAGGWCAPSETAYDLCVFETVEGILTVPEFQVNRGGIRWTEGPTFDDIYTACGFEQTEAETIAGDCKDCCMVDCPPFNEIRMDVIGLCVKSPILTETAYPELTQRFLEGAMVAHQHKLNKYFIDRMVLAATNGGTLPDTGSTYTTLLQLEYQFVAMRYRYRMALNQQLEIVAPFWMASSIMNDLDMEARRTSPASMADANAWFSARNVTVQWVYDFQDLTYVNECIPIVPAVATILLYPAGTWAKGTKDVITLDAVYDSPNLEANQYTALFTEEGILAVQKCTHTCAIDVPLCASGRRAVEDLALCLATAA